MKNMIIPSILTESLEDFVEKVENLKELKVERVSVDILDGVFADNLTVGLEDLWDIDFGKMSMDVQLMVVEPTDYLGQVHSLQASNKRVLGHIEKMGSVDEFVALTKELSMEVGLALDLYTPLSALKVENLLRVDSVLLMSVPVGFSGQEFKPQILNKIKELREMGFEQDIVMDGGMNGQTIPMCLEAGANEFAVTSELWKVENIEEKLKELVECLASE